MKAAGSDAGGFSDLVIPAQAGIQCGPSRAASELLNRSWPIRLNGLKSPSAADLFVEDSPARGVCDTA
ncbi:hypothetical protein [Nevskia ramosa]|uniref:hypothetical protein n=1 Tax=Nevskia ramosa TaxID=64002 RepID=UPI0023550B30|nr:hypothetical protein [Nevskia ramosa]